MNFKNKISNYYLSFLGEKFINIETQEDNTHLIESYSLAKYGSKKGRISMCSWSQRKWKEYTS